MIYKIEEYMKQDEENEKYKLKRIEVVQPVDGDEDTDYVGHLKLGVQTPMGPQELPLSFQIEAKNIEQAFDKFDEHADTEIGRAKAKLNEQMREAQQAMSKKIVTPDQDLKNKGNIINMEDIKKGKKP